jgi:hypothetical protein
VIPRLTYPNDNLEEKKTLGINPNGIQNANFDDDINFIY